CNRDEGFASPGRGGHGVATGAPLPSLPPPSSMKQRAGIVPWCRRSRSRLASWTRRSTNMAATSTEPYMFACSKCGIEWSVDYDVELLPAPMGGGPGTRVYYLG